MNREELEKRISKKQIDIEKIMRRVQKWNKGLTADQEYAAMEPDYRAFKRYMNDHPEIEYTDQVYELHRAYRDLRDANTTLNKYKNQLALEVSKNEATKVQAIVDFLNEWKQRVREYVAEDIKNADKYYQYNSEYCDLHNNKYHYMNKVGLSEDQWKEKISEAKNKERYYKEITNPLTFEVRWKGAEDHINHKRLDEILDKEAEDKYWNMIEKVTKYTGEITDASGLKVAGDGNLNGIIIGEDGKARLETIIAGGQNAGIIVNVKRGPIAHYRLIVNPIK